MADKKLNEVTANATVDYLIGTLNDGSTVRISMDNLGKVLSVLNVINAFSIKTDTTLEDANVTQSGIYLCRESTTANLPSSASGSSLLIAIKAHNNASYMIYFLFGLNTDRRFTRRKIDSSYTSWVEF